MFIPYIHSPSSSFNPLFYSDLSRATQRMTESRHQSNSNMEHTFALLRRLPATFLLSNIRRFLHLALRVTDFHRPEIAAYSLGSLAFSKQIHSRAHFVVEEGVLEGGFSSDRPLLFDFVFILWPVL